MRWRGWLADVFLGTGATYAGTAAIQAFILLGSYHKAPPPAPVTIPYVPDGTNLTSVFPSLISGITEVSVQPSVLELDIDAVLAIVVTGYLAFLPLQCWSGSFLYRRAKYVVIFLWNILMLAGTICALTYWPLQQRKPTQYMFCNPQYPPFDEISNDGWQSNLWKSSWNSTIWGIFSNTSSLIELESICFYPCFNTTQTLRQQSALEAHVVKGDLSHSSRKGLLAKVTYSQGYIYGLIALSVALNMLHLAFQIFHYPSRIPLRYVSAVWRDRGSIYRGLKEDFQNSRNKIRESICTDPLRLRTIRPLGIWKIFHARIIETWIYPVFDVVFLIILFFSVVVSPFTVIAFVTWIEWYIHNDGPPQEHIEQVGQWSPLVALGLVILSGGILRLKYYIASLEELDHEISKGEARLQELRSLRNYRDAKRTHHSGLVSS
ncbi:hypothetical protein PHISCL_00678 [Aspergillus sclerotialis]|uniref:Uncharacterized protein n=1 Tax=Aspergillus sclerotialis TaxID=2070753 RepID=A0A3A3A025_9EURO|nr:hypothetical protein PHISCL_00678 [Aspergillus sclerotialis]